MSHTEKPRITQMNADWKTLLKGICVDLRYLRFVSGETTHD